MQQFREKINMMQYTNSDKKQILENKKYKSMADAAFFEITNNDDEIKVFDDHFDAKAQKSMLQNMALGVMNPMIAMSIFAPEPAFAKGGAYGALECVPEALIHPGVMFFVLYSSLFTAYYGYQYRVLRTEGKTMDPEKRKELAAQKPKQMHEMSGSLILGGGIGTTILGCMNTYFRAGKLFPGPHLFIGAAICGGWAISASLTPYMAKGNEGARYAHIGINTFITGLFFWQVYTGLEITFKVISKGTCVVWPGLF